MPNLSPIYTSENVKFAYQIRWAMTLFTQGSLPAESTLEPVVSALELDGIRVLSYRYAEPSMVQLTLSVKRWLTKTVADENAYANLARHRSYRKFLG